MSFTTEQEPTPNQPVDIEKLLNQAAAGQLETGRIADLSDPTREQLQTFASVWVTMPVESRRFVIREMSRQGEANLALEFGRYFRYALRDDDPEVRALAVQALWEDTSTSLLHLLADLALQEEEAAVQEVLARSFGRFSYMAGTGELDTNDAERIEQVLFHLLQHGNNWMVRRRALESAGYLTGNERVNEAIQETYESDFEQEQAGALISMGNSLDERWYGVVVRELQNDDPDIRCEAARAAGQFGNPAAIDQLARLTDDDDEEVRQVAIESIGQIGGDPAIQMLRYLQKNVDEDLHPSIETAIEEAEFLAEPTGLEDR